MHHGYLALLAMWCAMTAAMMTPVVWPWLRALRTALPANASSATVPAFSVGYAAAWFAFSVLMAAGQLALVRGGATVPLTVGAPTLAGLALVMAGAFQFSRLKLACLDHCRSPFGYFATRWRAGAGGALQMGLRHGLFCLGCCWALMALALVVGAMDLRAMAALMAVMLLETLSPLGPRVSRPLGGVLVLVGARLILLG